MNYKKSWSIVSSINSEECESFFHWLSDEIILANNGEEILEVELKRLLDNFPSCKTKVETVRRWYDAPHIVQIDVRFYDAAEESEFILRQAQ